MLIKNQKEIFETALHISEEKAINEFQIR